MAKKLSPHFLVCREAGGVHFDMANLNSQASWYGEESKASKCIEHNMEQVGRLDKVGVLHVINSLFYFDIHLL